MKIFLLTTGGTEVGWSRHNDEGVFRDYEAEADRLFESAKPYGFECRKFDNEYFWSRPYYSLYKDVLNKVSFGFNMKSIQMHETMNTEMEFGDIVILTDSNHIVSNPKPVIEIAEKQDCFIYDHVWTIYRNREFTRRDTFVNMGCDAEEYWDAVHVQCNLYAFKKTPLTVEFARQYFEACLTYNIMFGEDKYPNFPEFKVHRHDQSIFSILRQKFKLPYIQRTPNWQWTEFLIPESSLIQAEHPVDNRHRMEEDRKENA